MSAETRPSLSDISSNRSNIALAAFVIIWLSMASTSSSMLSSAAAMALSAMAHLSSPLASGLGDDPPGFV
jgi:hypothetical protein